MNIKRWTKQNAFQINCYKIRYLIRLQQVNIWNERASNKINLKHVQCLLFIAWLCVFYSNINMMHKGLQQKIINKIYFNLYFRIFSICDEHDFVWYQPEFLCMAFELIKPKSPNRSKRVQENHCTYIHLIHRLIRLFYFGSEFFS